MPCSLQLIEHVLLDSYCEDIEESLYEIKRSAKSVMPENQEEIKELLRLVSQFIRAIVPRPADDDDDNLSSAPRVEDEDYADELGRLQFEYAETEEARIQPALKDTVIEDEASLVLVIGHSRLELVRSAVSGFTGTSYG